MKQFYFQNAKSAHDFSDCKSLVTWLAFNWLYPIISHVILTAVMGLEVFLCNDVGTGLSFEEYPFRCPVIALEIREGRGSDRSATRYCHNT